MKALISSLLIIFIGSTAFAQSLSQKNGWKIVNIYPLSCELLNGFIHSKIFNDKLSSYKNLKKQISFIDTNRYFENGCSLSLNDWLFNISNKWPNEKLVESDPDTIYINIYDAKKIGKTTYRIGLTSLKSGQIIDGYFKVVNNKYVMYKYILGAF